MFSCQPESRAVNTQDEKEGSRKGEGRRVGGKEERGVEGKEREEERKKKRRRGQREERR